MFAYVGTRTTRERNARGKGISLFNVDPGDGSLHLVEVTGELVNPSYQTISRQHLVLYTVHGDHDSVSAFKLNPANGQLSFLNQVSCKGNNPVHLALDPDERHLIVSNHLSSSLAVLSIHEDGSLGRVEQLVVLHGEPGPHRKEQPFSKPHFNPFDISGRFVLVPDKGLDRVFSFKAQDGRLLPCDPPYIQCRETSGPRHLAFHPDLPFVYVVNELDSTVTAYEFNVQNGALKPFQILSTLSDRYTDNSRAAGIQIASSGRFLYASNRGEDSIAVFEIDPSTGRMTFVQTAPSGGKTPRFFTLSPDGRHLYCLNEDSDTITIMQIDATNGRLSDVMHQYACESAVCMTFFQA